MTGQNGKPLRAGRFRLNEKLGEGYLGPVYRATDTETGKPVAVRFPGLDRQWDETTRVAILADCHRLRSLKHPNIVSLLEAAEDDGNLYLASELVKGRDILAFSAEGPLSIDRRLSVMLQIAEGFAYAHSHEILHCGFKPSKAVLTPGGGVRLRDFGLYRIFSRHLSRPLVRWGSSIYLSPEQVDGAECTPQSDIFTAGVVFYQFLTGIHPFQDENGNRTLDRILKDVPLPVDAILVEAPPGMASLVRNCLAKAPRDRFREMEELSAGLTRILDEVAEDSKVMLTELLGALRPLRVAAALPEASSKLRTLLADIEAMSVREDRNDYCVLNNLMSRLFEQYPVVHAFTAELPPEDSEEPLARMPEMEVAPVAEQPKVVEATAVPVEAQTSTVHSGLEAAAGPDLFAAPPSLPLSPAAEPTAIPPAEVAAGTAESEPAVPVSSKAPVERHTHFRGVAGGPQPASVPAQPEPEVPPVPRPETATPLPAADPVVHMPRSFSLTRRMPRQRFARAAALMSVLLILVAAYMVRGTSASFLRSMWGRSDGQSAVRPGSPAPPNPGTGAGLEAQSSQADGAARIDDRTRAVVLTEEATQLFSASKWDESRAMALRALTLDPQQERAQALLRAITAAEAALEEARQEPVWNSAYAGAAELAATAPVPVARQAIERLQRQFPNRSEVLTLRKRLDARAQKEAREQARRELEANEAARNRQKIDDEWTSRVNGLLQQGKYSDAGGALNQWLAQNPGSASANGMRTRIEDAERAFRAYEEAFGGKRYHDALTALASLEAASPGDPRLAEMRRKAEDGRSSARAAISVYRLNLKGGLQLNGRVLGSGDEVENESVPAGVHTLVVKGEGGQHISRNLDLIDGQRVALVYDIRRQLLRPMVEADREVLAARRLSEEVHRFPLEHSHGLLRGSCRGELLISLQEVEYVPANLSHPFKIPFRQTGLKTDGRWVTLLDATTGQQLHSFKAVDMTKASNLKQTWEKLKALSK